MLKQVFGNLHRIGSSSLAEVVRNDPHVQGFVAGTTIVLETEASGGVTTALPMDTSFVIRFGVTYFT